LDETDGTFEEVETYDSFADIPDVGDPTGLEWVSRATRGGLYTMDLPDGRIVLKGIDDTVMVFTKASYQHFLDHIRRGEIPRFLDEDHE